MMGPPGLGHYEPSVLVTLRGGLLSPDDDKKLFASTL